MEDRFDRNGECKCVHIADGKCHQTSIGGLKREMNKPRIKIWKSANGTTDVTVYSLPNTKMVDFFSLYDVWGSRGYDRWNDDGLYFECPAFLYDIIEEIPFIRLNGIIVERL